MARKKILAVDDDPFYLDLYRRILEPKGYDVAVAQDPAAGFEAAESKKPDLVILDVMLPEEGGFRDGFDLLERLRKERALHEVPVIMISALGDPADVKHGMDLGASLYMAKHETVPEKLIKEVARLLGEE